MRPTLYLIDGTALLYRSHFAFIANPLVNSKGQHTSAIFGVINSFLRLLELKHADHILISFDRKAPTFRHELSEAYKANRPPMPDDLISQIEPVKQFFELIGLPEISLDGYEADDVLATLAERYKTDYDVVLVTSDKDYSQLVEAGVSIWDPAKDVTLDSDAVFTKFGVRPQQFIDYLALVGDASDNIPGVKGIGPKGAVDLLTQFGSLDNIYTALEQVPEKYRKKLEADKDAALLSRTLATIIRDVPIEPVHLKPFDASSLVKAADLLSAYELLNLKRRMESRYSKPAIKEDTATQQADIF
ncbi:MAG TPA: 5'-3' exonuclease H3TH domain-containing protein, partial [Candidatus Cloacimonadota bacterium]|nr:5'-3' exonuclease H3TH domain-containing protein [Candidatus Cloacimonadota bacterium]